MHTTQILGEASGLGKQDLLPHLPDPRRTQGAPSFGTGSSRKLQKPCWRCGGPGGEGAPLLVAGWLSLLTGHSRREVPTVLRHPGTEEPEASLPLCSFPTLARSLKAPRDFRPSTLAAAWSTCVGPKRAHSTSCRAKQAGFAEFPSPPKAPSLQGFSQCNRITTEITCYSDSKKRAAEDEGGTRADVFPFLFVQTD